MIRRCRIPIWAWAAAAVCATAAVHATTLNFSGDLTSDDQVAYYDLTLGSSSTVTFETDSYATGGFPTVLSLFTSGGSFLDTNGASGASTCSGADQTAVAPTAGATPVCGDAYLSESLSAGSYILALSEYPNFPSASGTSVENGFQFSGQGNFTSGSNGCGTGGGGAFYDLAGACEERTGAFSISISGAGLVSASQLAITSSLIPEPASLLLTAPALLWLLHRKRVARRR